MRFAKMLPLHSIRSRVVLAYVAGTILSIALSAGAGYALLQSSTFAKADVGGLAEDMAQRVQFDPSGRPVSLAIDECNHLAWIYDSLGREIGYRVVDESGTPALVSGDQHTLWPTAPVVTIGRPKFAFERNGVAFIGAAETIVHDGRTWTFQLVATDRLMTLMHRVAMPLIGGGILVFSMVLLCAFAFFAFITLRYTLRPLHSVSESAAAISPTALNARLSTVGVPAEVVPLVRSFNRALSRLESGYRAQQEFLGHAAHELKTPLALIRAQIELSEEDNPGRAALIGDVDYMTRQVQQLLALAEASEAYNYHILATNLADIVLDAMRYLDRMSTDAGVKVSISAACADVFWMADRSAFFTLLKNLLENAIQHSRPHGKVDVELHADALTIRDYGPGVSPQHLPLLFDRFWRGTHRRDQGAGLGLAICRKIAAVHGWTLTAEPASPGLRLRIAPEADKSIDAIDTRLSRLLDGEVFP
ncbi:MAG: Swarming motility regulation sensor protein RssA [Luteibacter sp.]|uniref:HAMP domain-containing sensor histidine kinase n=1 Tax=Luteibacter sp. TaxID=1886636 RepID=UPI00137FE257|nr:HAMP domain-containing sensor histidine kinase [Luteibacter sp.]KAF1008930.1 MAG: Swarming motility regulation sensor protein RssA [Luteibacter sp.]